MYRYNWLVPFVCAVFLFGCASRQKAKTIKSHADTTKASQSKSASSQAGVNTPVRAVKSADGLIDGEIVGTPAPGSKFAQLQIGMTREQVENLIGRPNDTDSRITGKQFQPFYFGGDTQRTEAFYNNEGQLTFSNIHPDNAADTLIRIMVNPEAAGNH
jgi:SmpA / OmlA family